MMMIMMGSLSPFPSLLLLASLLISAQGAAAAAAVPAGDPLPIFLEPVNNATVVIGRDAILTCVVDNIGPNTVAWIHLDRQMIVAIHQHLVTRIPRYSASHDSHRNTWTLHLRGAQPEDAGRYMCQVNSNPMVTQIGIVDVVVPPSILDTGTSASHITVREGVRVTLTCKGDGVPAPKVLWRREDGRAINIGERKKEVPVPSVEGETLTLHKVTRQESGAYLCIASNGVPPSVSKRILLDVEFAPMVWVPVQLVGAPLGGFVTFDCHTESQPKAISYWVRSSGHPTETDLVMLPSRKIHTEVSTNGYRTQMKLTILQLEAQDLGTYRCVAKNSLGEADGTVKLIETEVQTSPTHTMATYPVRANAKKSDTSSTKYVTDSFQIRSWTTATPQQQQQPRNRFQNSSRTDSQSITSHAESSGSSELLVVISISVIFAVTSSKLTQ